MPDKVRPGARIRIIHHIQFRGVTRCNFTKTGLKYIRIIHIISLDIHSSVRCKVDLLIFDHSRHSDDIVPAVFCERALSSDLVLLSSGVAVTNYFHFA
jgi:hypothetical protein